MTKFYSATKYVLWSFILTLNLIIHDVLQILTRWIDSDRVTHCITILPMQSQFVFTPPLYRVVSPILNVRDKSKRYPHVQSRVFLGQIKEGPAPTHETLVPPRLGTPELDRAHPFQAYISKTKSKYLVCLLTPWTLLCSIPLWFRRNLAWWLLWPHWVPKLGYFQC